MKIYRTILLFLLILGIPQNAKGQEITRKNAVIAETNFFFSSSISYNRILIAEKTNFFVGGGYVIGSNFGSGSNWINIEGGLLLFGPKHNMEAGALLMIGLNDETYPGFKMAYRFLGTKGLIFRPAISIYFPEYAYFAPSIGLGYAF